MKTLDYIAVQDKDDPPFISLGHGCVLGTWWEAQIFLIGNTGRELVVKPRGDFPLERPQKTSLVLRFGSALLPPVFAGMFPAGSVGGTERLLGTAGEVTQDLPGAELPPPVLPSCPSSVSPQGHVEPALEETNFLFFLGKGAVPGGSCTFCAPDATAAAPQGSLPMTPPLPKAHPAIPRAG